MKTLTALQAWLASGTGTSHPCVDLVIDKLHPHSARETLVQPVPVMRLTLRSRHAKAETNSHDTAVAGTAAS